MEQFYVRLKPYNPGVGQYRIDYIAPWGTKYITGVWHEGVSEEAAQYLRHIKERDNDPNSKPAFDVCTLAQAKALIQAERVQAMQQTAQSAAVQQPRLRAPEFAKSRPSNALNAPDVTHVLEQEAIASSRRPPVWPGEAPAHSAPVAPQELGGDEGDPGDPGDDSGAEARDPYPYEALTVMQLRAEASKRGISTKGMRKADIVEALRGE